MSQIMMLLLLWSLPGMANESYTWICQADYTLHGNPDPTKLESLSTQINQELDKRKEERLRQTCTAGSIESYQFDVRYAHKPKKNKTSTGTYSHFLADLSSKQRLEETKIIRKKPITLEKPIDELDLKSFSCIFSCQPPQDLSHIR